MVSGNVTTQGSGVGSFLLSFILHYNMMEVKSTDVFDVTVTIVSSDTNSLELRACGRLVGEVDACNDDGRVGIPADLDL